MESGADAFVFNHNAIAKNKQNMPFGKVFFIRNKLDCASKVKSKPEFIFW